MKTVLVTGADGFIGKNLCVTLEQRNDIKLLRFGRGDAVDILIDYASRADFVFHLAGINRPQTIEEYEQGNHGFTRKLLSILEDSEKKAPLLITSSIQAGFDSPYGASKKAAENAVFEWSERTGVPIYVYRLPNVFGKWCKPNYNSVVATFCHNIAHGLPIQINNPITELTLAYIDDVVMELVASMDGLTPFTKNGFCYIARVFKITLKELADIIYSFEESRKNLIVPNFEGDFERYLYATYVSYLPKARLSYDLEVKLDNRGWLAEFIKSKQFGQIFISRTKPGITRGNHWHHTKVEKILVVEGDAIIRFRNLSSNETIEYQVSGEQIRAVDIPVGYIHSMTNIGNKDVIALFWSDEIFNSDEPDTYYLEV